MRRKEGEREGKDGKNERFEGRNERGKGRKVRIDAGLGRRDLRFLWKNER